MKVGERKVAIAAAIFAVVGIALLFFLSETPQKSSIGRALASNGNTLVELRGTVANVTKEKFSLCERLCISVRGGSLPSTMLAAEGRQMKVVGRIKEFKGSRYVVAEKMELLLGE